jgi:hypothetical protein
LGETLRRKNITFVKQLADVFQAHPRENEPEEEEALIQLLEAHYHLEPPIKRFKRAEVQDVISNLNHKKSSGYGLITGKILKELPIIGITQPVIQCCSVQGILPSTMESSRGDYHLEARRPS